MNRCTTFAVTGALSLAAAGCSALSADDGDYPTDDITFVIPYEPGGTSDPMGRAFAKGLEENLGVNVVVVNRPGAGATVGTSQIVTAEPDGYLIGMSTNAALAYYPLVEPSLPWKGPEDYQSIAKIADNPAVLAVRADAPWKSFDDFVAAAERNPGTIQVSSSGEGSGSDLIMREFVRESDLDIDVVPFSGGAGEAEIALLGDRVEGNITFPAAVKGEVDAGRMRVLGVFDDQPIDLYPDAVPVNETYDVDTTSAFYVVAPAGLPDEVLDALVDAAAKTTETTEFQTFVTENGSTAEVLGPDEISEELAGYKPIYQKAIE